MFEKVNPSHPDKIADRIAGAIVDLAYKEKENPKVAAEILIGHGECNIIVESDVQFTFASIYDIVLRISQQKDIVVNYKRVQQDINLALNQYGSIKCGDNGIFKGMPITDEENSLAAFVRHMYSIFPSDGKYIYDKENNLVIGCQSYIQPESLHKYLSELGETVIANPLGYWTGGIECDSGATNRKLGSDMGRSVTGGGLHGKDLSKADVSINIYCFLKAQELQRPYELYCAIGDEYVDGKPYSEIVNIAKEYIEGIGGFEKLAEWGLI